jgi:anhydro-N-acetylmuramic acid kinase
MHKDLIRLTEIARAETRTIIGLMSGTSLDGLDIALCQFQGSGRSTQVKLLHFTTVPYNNELKAELKSISSKPVVDLQKVTLLNAYLGNYHAALILKSLENWNVLPQDVDLIASHGQTIFHAPFAQHQQSFYPNATLQIGDGDHIAVKTGIITLSDFRQKHIAAGGEGAPLAIYGDYLIFSDESENRLLLNIGGIANFTYVPAVGNAEKLLSTDTGPGNTIMDQYVQRQFPGKQYDADGEIAASGEVDPELLNTLLNLPFFDLPFPKTTGPEVFSLRYLDQALSTLRPRVIEPKNILATLATLTAKTIVTAIKKCIPANQQYKIYISGGGMHNKHLVENIAADLGQAAMEIRSTLELGINPDAKEAVLFALLANECIRGESASAKNDPNLPAISMGKISLPS